MAASSSPSLATGLLALIVRSALGARSFVASLSANILQEGTFEKVGASVPLANTSGYRCIGAL